MRKVDLRFKIIIYIVLIVLAFVCLLPFFWMLSTSLKGRAEVFSIPIQWIPEVPLWSNYVKALTVLPFGTYALNTLILEIFIITGKVLSCTLVAYGFSRFRFKGREFLFMLMLATQLIPEQVTMIPTFMVFSELGWVNTFLPLIVPSFFGSPFYIFLVRQYLQSIPHELDEAAKIDGAGAFRTLVWVMLPLLRPVMTIVVVFTFMDVYDDFMHPLLYLNDPEKFTLAVGLANFVSAHGTEWNLLMAASTVMLLPLLLIYYFAQKNLIGGIASLGIKG